MAVLAAMCPHCATERVAFESQTEWRLGESNTDRLVVFRCNKCDGAIAVHVRSSVGAGLHGQPGPLNPRIHSVVTTYPQPAPIDCPADTPDAVTRLYLQAHENRRGNRLDAAAMTGRKALELAVRQIGEARTGEPLAQAIDRLRATGHLTDALQQWAHAVRLLGNEAAHEAEEPAPVDVDDLLAFLHVFLLYAFTLPALVARRRP